MQDTKAAPVSESASRNAWLVSSPSGAELGYTLLALFSFAAALYALWLACISAGLTPSQNPAALGPATAGIAWGPVVLACLVAAGLIWISVSMLNKSSYLASVRHLFALTQELDLPAGVKLEVIVAAVGTEVRRFAPKLMPRPPEDEALRAAVAGNWMLERFREGASVMAVPKSLATSERLQTAFGPLGDRSIQILHNDLDLRNAESVP